MTDVFLRAGNATPSTVILRDPTQPDASSKTAVLEVTLDGVTVGLAATSGHPATESATLDDITVALAATSGHPATEAVTLDDVTVAASGTVGHPATLALTLADIAFDATATVSGGSASLTATLEITLDGISVSADASKSASKVGGDDAGWRKEKKRKKRDEYTETQIARKLSVIKAYNGLLEPETPEPVAIEAKTVIQSGKLEDLDLEKVQKLLAMWQTELDRREEQDDEETLLMLL